jgi:uncharacterized RDD family membrane protein YckC
MSNSNSNSDNEIDDLLDNFEFKPITEGLGFHHSLKEKAKVVTELNLRSDSLKKDIQTRVNILSKDEIISASSDVNMGELAPFYNENNSAQTTPPVLALEEKSEEEFVSIAHMGMRLFAWIIDILVLITSMLVTFASIVFFAELPMESLSALMISDQISTSFLFIGSLFYIFYFTFLDKTSYSSLGKNILGLKIISQKKSNRVSLAQSFFRVLLSILSLPLLGLPLLLRVQDRLTETQVIDS